MKALHTRLQKIERQDKTFICHEAILELLDKDINYESFSHHQQQALRQHLIGLKQLMNQDTIDITKSITNYS